MKNTHVAEAVEKLQAYCWEKNLKFTEPRRLAYEAILGSSRPLSAYDVIDAIGKVKAKPKPPTAYRAIKFLSDIGFIHRIESLNAYTPCQIGKCHEGVHFMLCRECGSVEELSSFELPGTVRQQVDTRNFKVVEWSTEFHGTCTRCQK